MKTTTCKYPYLLLMLIVLSSCSITSRRYMSGYHVEWRSKKAAIHQNAVINKSVKRAYPMGVPVFASNDVQNPVSKSVVMPDDRSGTKQVNRGVVNKLIAKSEINSPIPVINGYHEKNEANDKELGARLANKSFHYGIYSLIFIGGVALIGTIAWLLYWYYQIYNIELDILLVVGLGGVLLAGLILATIAFFMGVYAKQLIGKDDTMQADTKKAKIGMLIGGIILGSLLLLLIISAMRNNL